MRIKIRQLHLPNTEPEMALDVLNYWRGVCLHATFPPRGRMKTVYALVIGFALVLAASATYATPEGSDPSVIINKTTDPTEIITANSVEDPLIINLTDGLFPVTSFQYDGPTALSTLTELYVQLDGALPSEQFFCQSNIFTGPCGSFSTGVGDDVGLIFTGGVITSGEDLTVEVSAPEPQSWILLTLSMFALLMLGMKYWEPNRSVE
jgi:hypothetical protein